MTIKEAREKAKLTQLELARKSGVSDRSIQHYENGRQIPNVKVALKMAKALGLSVEDLFG